MPTAETNFKNRVNKYLKSIGAYNVPYPASMFGIRGTPDRLVCLNGFFLGIEAKAENGKPSELQLEKIKEIKRAGGVALVLYPRDFEKFKKLCEQILELENPLNKVKE